MSNTNETTKGETMKTTDHRSAEDAYAAAHIHAMGILEDIRDTIEDAPAPSDRTNWAHVGSMEEIVRQLTAIRDFARDGNA